MTALRIEVDGVVYRVLDGITRRGKLIVADPPAPWATSRIFRPRTGYKRLYLLVDAADRQIDEATLRRQLRAAEYLAEGPVRPWDVDPR
jgi:hypothetical protein